MAITFPYTFQPSTTAASAEVNANFSTISTYALNKTGDTMTGDLKFTDASYDIGKAGLTRPRDLFLSRNATIGGTLAVTGNVVSNLLFTDATYDIGAVGATRPRDLFLSRNLSVAGGQIVFPATQVPSVNANTLDDFEKNTWTPVIGGAGGTSGQAYTSQVGRYIKIGPMVIAWFSATLSTKGTITGNVQIQGLPFTSVNAGQPGSGHIGYFQAMTTNWIALTLIVNANSTVAPLEGSAAAAAQLTALVTGDISNLTGLSGTIMYEAAT